MKFGVKNSNLKGAEARFATEIDFEASLEGSRF
jgi:hypothetical protein